MEELAKNVTRVRDAVATYCGKYHIATAFAICDVYQRPSAALMGWQNSPEVSRAVRSERVPWSSRRSFSIASLRWAIRASLLERSACALAASALATAALASATAALASALRRAWRSARIIACAAARSDGSNSAASFMRRWNHIRRDLQAKTVSRPRSDARFPADGASRSRRAGNRAARRRLSPHRRPRSATGSGPAPAAW